jgi:hypothetical protein
VRFERVSKFKNAARSAHAKKVKKTTRKAPLLRYFRMRILLKRPPRSIMVRIGAAVVYEEPKETERCPR